MTTTKKIPSPANSNPDQDHNQAATEKKFVPQQFRRVRLLSTDDDTQRIVYECLKCGSGVLCQVEIPKAACKTGKTSCPACSDDAWVIQGDVLETVSVPSPWTGVERAVVPIG